MLLSRTWILGVALLAMTFGRANAVSVTPGEMSEANSWATAKFAAVVEKTSSSKSSLTVLANNDPVQLNSRAGGPMRIGDKEYKRGLYCHAISKIVVNLSGPAKNFSAVVGVDNNDQTSGGRGSVVFTVEAGGKEVYKSAVLRGGMAAVPVSVDLGGAKQFVLCIGDGGDGIACDQSDWADAKVTMADGSVKWLGDMPIEGSLQKQPYSTDVPFSFSYDGRSSADLLKDWKVGRKTDKIDAKRTRTTTTYTDPKTGLQVRWVGVQYSDFPTVEWTVYFKNNGKSDTPILSNILALDTRFERGGQSDFVLHHQKGTFVRADDFEPLTTPLGPNAKIEFAPPGGRPCGAVLPYYNLSWGGEGLIAVVGWPGQWSADFTRDAVNGIQLRAGQQLTNLKLHPGEEIRTPLIALQFYNGDWIRAQNVWRRWMLEHNVPRQSGKLPTVQATPCSSHQFAEMMNANEENQNLFIDRYIEEGMKPDYWWMDAGWYVSKSGWPNTGTWEVDTKRFPNGLRAISDHAHSKGVKTIVWFEPERVTPDTWLWDTHPEWLLKSDVGTLLNVGDPNALKWLIEHIDKLIVEQGIDLYRQDYNVDPLKAWRAADAPDRQGITENHYVTGYLAYWDELRRRHPNMLIDSCASGGHRNDLESMRRAVPLLRSDYIMEPIGQQGHTYGLSFWLPFFGTGSARTSSYDLRSSMCNSFTPCWDMRRTDLDYPALRKIFGQWREYAANFVGDFYPLTSYTLDTAQWMAWQFVRPESGEGMVQAFRRQDSAYLAAQFKLQGLDPDATYALTNVDKCDPYTAKGSELMENGVKVEVDERPGAVVITYKKLGS